MVPSGEKHNVKIIKRYTDSDKHLVCVVAEAFGLTNPDSYHYLRQSSCPADKTINDKGTFQDVQVRRTPTLSHTHLYINQYTHSFHAKTNNVQDQFI